MANTFPHPPLQPPDAPIRRWAKRPGDLDLWLESGFRVMCDVDYICANFSLPRPLCFRLRPDVCDRQTYRQTSDRRQTDRCQTSDSVIALCPRLLGAGHNNPKPKNGNRRSEPSYTTKEAVRELYETETCSTAARCWYYIQRDEAIVRTQGEAGTVNISPIKLSIRK